MWGSLIRQRKYRQAATELAGMRGYYYFSGRIARILAESAIKNKNRPGGFEREMDVFKARLEAMVVWSKVDPEGHRRFLAELSKNNKSDAV